MGSTGTDRDDELVAHESVLGTILDALRGPRVVWRDGEPAVDLSAFDRPFAPAVQGTGRVLAVRRSPDGRAALAR